MRPTLFAELLFLEENTGLLYAKHDTCLQRTFYRVASYIVRTGPLSGSQQSLRIGNPFVGQLLPMGTIQGIVSTGETW